jgi:hypothetical protein
MTLAVKNANRYRHTQTVHEFLATKLALYDIATTISPASVPPISVDSQLCVRASR